MAPLFLQAAGLGLKGSPTLIPASTCQTPSHLSLPGLLSSFKQPHKSVPPALLYALGTHSHLSAACWACGASNKISLPGLGSQGEAPSGMLSAPNKISLFCLIRYCRPSFPVQLLPFVVSQSIPSVIICRPICMSLCGELCSSSRG